MTIPEVSVATAAVLIVMQLGLMLSVGLHRASAKIGVGHGEDEHLHRKIRRHANMAENAPLFMIALGLAEMSGASAAYLAPIAALFVAARVSHALAFTSLSGSHGPNSSVMFPTLRAAGAFGTIGSGIGLTVVLLGQLL
ncbi:MAG: MAPEG family protein [Pseudomonadota bacterium]